LIERDDVAGGIGGGGLRCAEEIEGVGDREK
jgi:hypothetical protein